MTHLLGHSAHQDAKDSDFLTIEEVAAELGRASRHTVLRLESRDPSFPIGADVPGLKGRRWVRGDLDAWKAAQVAQARAVNAQRLAQLTSPKKKGGRHG